MGNLSPALPKGEGVKKPSLNLSKGEGVTDLWMMEGHGL